MDKNKIFITIAAVAGLFGFLAAAYFMTNRPEPPQVVEALQTTREGDHKKWAQNSRNVLINYSDFQCPACAAAHDFLKRLEKEEGITQNITYVYRHFPLLTIHPHANEAAYAAEAAGKQGKFFEMADLIFENQEAWSKENDAKPVFRSYAEQLKLNMQQYDKDLASDEVRQKVAADRQSGSEAGIAGTPTFFLNGQRVSVTSYESFKRLLQEKAAEGE